MARCQKHQRRYGLCRPREQTHSFNRGRSLSPRRSLQPSEPFLAVNYAVGDTVNIVDEIFDGFTGRVEAIDVDNNMVRVTVSALFGKETMVELELDQVEPIAD